MHRTTREIIRLDTKVAHPYRDLLRSIWGDPRTIHCETCRDLIAGKRRAFVIARDAARINREAWAKVARAWDSAEVLGYAETRGYVETRGSGGRRRLATTIARTPRRPAAARRRRAFPIDAIDVADTCATLTALLDHAWDRARATPTAMPRLSRALRHLRELGLHGSALEIVSRARPRSRQAVVAERAVAKFLEVAPRTIRRILSERSGLWAAKANATKTRRLVERILR